MDSKEVFEGVYVKKIDWTNPQYSLVNIQNLGELNKKQNRAFFDPEEEEAYGPNAFTEEEEIAAFTLLECRVDLSHANVCKGVERSWPKKLFGVNDFEQLNREQKQNLYKKMEKYGTHLYSKYVDENRMAQRREHARHNANAHRYELRLRTHMFNRLKALEEPNDADEDDETVAGHHESTDSSSFDSCESTDPFYPAENGETVAGHHDATAGKSTDSYQTAESGMDTFNDPGPPSHSTPVGMSTDE